jgi:transposase-like protein
MKTTPVQTVEEKEKHWTNIIEEARKYPQGVKAYCTANDIILHRYYSWFTRLRRSHPEWTDLSNTPTHTRKPKRIAQPDTEVTARPRRRKFNAKERARILKETDASSSGKVAAILRREGIYATQLHQWRLERERGTHQAKKRGRTGNPLTALVNQLQAQCVQLEKQLKQANAIIELQKKISEILAIVPEVNATQ